MSKTLKGQENIQGEISRSVIEDLRPNIQKRRDDETT